MSEQFEIWNGAAGRAWADLQTPLDRALQPFEDILVDAVSTGRVLDVGCGTGSTTLALARRVRPNGSCMGIDISEPMLAAARARAARESLPVTFVQADAQTHPFESASFDAITSRFGVMFFEDPVAAFTNLRRALRQGGQLVFIAFRSAAENPFMTTAARAAAPLLDLPSSPPGAPGQFAFGDGERVRRILEESGWAKVDIQPMDVVCTMPENVLIPYVSRLGPVGRALQQADESLRGRVLETVRAAFDRFVHGSEVRFTNACWMVRASW